MNIQGAKIKTILLDLDETIYDQQYACLSGLKAVRAEFPAWEKVDIYEMETLYFHLLHARHLEVIDGKMSEDDAHISRFKDISYHYGIAFSTDSYQEMITLYNDASSKNKRAIPEATGAVRELYLKNYQIILLTNGRGENQRKKVKLCELETYLHGVLISEEIGSRKPDQKIYEEALRISASKPEECIMVGDSLDSDIKGALQMKIQPIWVNRRNAINPLPDKIIQVNHIKELLSWTNER